MIKMLDIDKVSTKQLVAQSLNGNFSQSNKTDKFCESNNNSRLRFGHDFCVNQKEQKRTPSRARLLIIKM